jgi:hypothetical protein
MNGGKSSINPTVSVTKIFLLMPFIALVVVVNVVKT